MYHYKRFRNISKYPSNISLYSHRQCGSISQPYGVKSALSCTITVIKLLFNFKSSFIVYILYNIFFKFSNFILSGGRSWDRTNRAVGHLIYSQARYLLRNILPYWHWWLDLNQRIQESKSCALPLGDIPKWKRRGGPGVIPDPPINGVG